MPSKADIICQCLQSSKVKTSKRNFKKRKFKTLLSFEGEKEKKNHVIQTLI